MAQNKDSSSLTPVRPEIRLRPVTGMVEGQHADLALYQLKLMAAHLQLVTGFEELLVLGAIRFQPFEYQIRAARTALRRFRGRGLLADEVGLGKTIEAGLVLKEYLLRQMVSRVLILTPPGLVEQWQEELAVKFDLTDFVTSNSPDFRSLGAGAWEHYPHVIASLATARRAEHAMAITAKEYDLVIVDEAHHLKNRSSASWQLVNALQKKYILLLTATPVQNRLTELHNLVTVLKPGQLKSPKEFSQQFVARGDPRLPRNRALLRELLADVMVRHTRGQISLKLPPRRAHTIRLKLHADEQALYDGITTLARRMMEDQITSAHRFGVLTLLREAGSSAAATLSTLRSLAQIASLSPYRTSLLRLVEQAETIRGTAKADALHKLLAAQMAGGRDDKVILFTQFRATQEMLAERLRGENMPCVVYHGGLSAAQKDAAIREFQDKQPILLSTEAAGEGRNLQFCRVMVNFDLPWNPMRIEQRIGRIHRVGQDRPVDIFNLAAEGTIEDFVLDILDHKLNMFELVIGEVDMILGQMGDERDFEEIILDIWTQARSREDLQQGMTGLGEDLVKARAAYQHAQEYDEALFGEDFNSE
ncbi:DEAD/DEAH box helicase [Candidatus Amarolinea aalborgensis]|uniref:DEAD/DEAH box helicase n=1 Tax=Candidatus Amarolinea aalborgensis TaxID=2249329 RepID=UPI003BF971E3